jgi:hypothetical protein
MLSWRLAHRLCAAWKAPHPRASPPTAAGNPQQRMPPQPGDTPGASGAVPGSGAAIPAVGAGGDSGLVSVMAVSFLVEGRWWPCPG